MTSHAEDGDQSGRDELLGRLIKIEGQVRGIRRMIEDERSCGDVLQQIAALKSAADAVAVLLLEAHLRTFVARALSADGGGAYAEDVIEAVHRLVRTSASRTDDSM